MKCVVTGANSFLGRSIIGRLLDDGWTVYAVCRNPESLDASLRGDLHAVKADMSDYASLDTLIPSCDVLINLAWMGTGHDGRDNAALQALNVQYSLDAMRASARMGCKVFVESGSQAEYGYMASPVTEEAECHPFTEYGRAKLEMREKASALAATLGMSYIHLRIFSLYGEHDHPWTLVMYALSNMFAGNEVKLSACTQSWNFLHVDDAADRIVRLVGHAMSQDSPYARTYNIASRDTRPLREYVEEMKHIAASTSRLDYAEPKPGLLSLLPVVDSMEADTGIDTYVPFSEGIKRIINHISHNDKSI